MNTQLLIDLTHKPSGIPVRFWEAQEVEGISKELAAQGVALFDIDASAIQSRDDLFKAFAIVSKMPNLLSPEPFGGLAITRVYSGVGADIVRKSIS